MQKQILFDKYLDIFSVFPSLILTGHEDIFIEEAFAIYNPNHNIKFWVIAPSAITDDKIKNPRDRLKYCLTESNINEKMNGWHRERSEALNGMLNLVKNFPPKNKKYTKSEIIEFIEKAGEQQIGYRKEKIDQIIGTKKVCIDNFPSLKASLHVAFQKFYVDKTKPKLSCVFDIVISSLFPYVDCVITESHQNEVINKINKIEPELFPQEHYSIKEIFY